MINLILGLIVLSKSSQKFISISIAICLSFAYGGLQIWENFNPLWLFVSSSFLSVFISIILFYIFIKQPLNRIGIALISTSMGQMLYSFVGISYGFLESIGDLKYLTDVVLIVMTLMVWFKMKRFSEIIEQGIKNGAFRMKT
nr:hypothetical protein [Salinibacillus kushneri]